MWGFTKKVDQGKRISKMQKNLVKLPCSAQKLLLRVLSLILIFYFDFQSSVKIRLCKLGYKCLTALLTLTETRLKGTGKTKDFTKFFTWKHKDWIWSSQVWSTCLDSKWTVESIWSMWPCMRSSLIILLAVRSAFSAEKNQKK